MRIGVTGASGMLGTELVSRLSTERKVFATSRNKGIESKNIKWSCFDLSNIGLLNKWLNEIKPDLIIHCAAIINLDFCEENVELTTQLHVETTRVISNYLSLNNGRLIYISTDSVFDGKKIGPYSESDLVNPLNIYAKTKLMGEGFVQSMDNGLILRVNIVGWATKKNSISFSEWVLKGLVDNTPLNLFHDVNFSPLNVYSLSLIVEKIIDSPIFGLYHCTSSDSISKYDFGKKMAEIFQLSDSNINKISVHDVKFKAIRPKNMALDIGKISLALEYDFPSVSDAIKLMKHQYNNQ